MKSSTSETASPVCFWSNDWQAGVHLFYVQDWNKFANNHDGGDGYDGHDDDDDDDDKATLFDNLSEGWIAVWHIPEEEEQRSELGFQVLIFGIS